jgi:hypothetical protein
VEHSCAFASGSRGASEQSAAGRATKNADHVGGTTRRQSARRWENSVEAKHDWPQSERSRSQVWLEKQRVADLGEL